MAEGKTHDVVVVGAGAIGLACAWRLAQAGADVLVVERDQPGAGASGVAAGMLAPVTEAVFGEEELLALNLDSARMWPAFDAELSDCAGGVDCGYQALGALLVAVDRDDAEELRRVHDFQVRLGLDAEWLVPSACRDVEPAVAPRIAGGVLAPHEAQVDPRAVVRALEVAARAAGAELLSGVEVVALERSGGRVTGIQTTAGSFSAGTVVVAAGSWSGTLDPSAPPIRPVKGQIVSLRGSSAPALTSRLVRTLRCYVVNRGDGRVVVGATMEERGFDREPTAGGVHGLLEAAREVLPELLELELTGVEAGLRPGTPDNAPAVGPGRDEGLVWATGHHRNGMLLAPATAAALTGLLQGDGLPPGFEAFDPGRFDSERQESSR